MHKFKFYTYLFLGSYLFALALGCEAVDNQSSELPSGENPQSAFVAEGDLEATQRSFGNIQYTFALTKGTTANPSLVYAIDVTNGDRIGNGVNIEVVTPSGAIQVVPVVTGITASIDFFLPSTGHHQNHYYVNLGDNSATFPTIPELSNHMWSINVVYSNGVQEVQLDRMVMPTTFNGNTIKDICWSDGHIFGIACGSVGLIDGMQDEMVYFDAYNWLQPTALPIVHSFAPDEVLEGLSWVDPFYQLGCPYNPPGNLGPLYLSTYRPTPTPTMTIYQLDFDNSTGSLQVIASPIDYFDESQVTAPMHGLGHVFTTETLLMGTDPNNPLYPIGSIKFHQPVSHCLPPTIGGGGVQSPNLIITEPIEDFMTHLEQDPFQ